MAFPKLDKDISYISKLADEPNDVSGGELSAADLKVEFDKAGNDIKAFLNDTLIPYLQGIEAAASIGISTISGLSDIRDVQAALEALKYAIDNVAVGGIPDASLTGAKFVEKSITNRELGLGAVEGKNVAVKTLTGDKFADKTMGGAPMQDEFIEHRHLGKLVVEDENVADNSINAGGKLKKGSLTASTFALGAVDTPAIANGAVTKEKLDPNLQLDSNDVYIGTEQPTGENKPKVWINPADTRLPLTMTTLWTNPNPTAEFAEQTIKLDLSGYDGIYVEADYSTNAFCRIGQSAMILTDSNDETHGGTVMKRGVTATQTSVLFEDCVISNIDYYNDHIIPLRIYGIKGGQLNGNN